MDPNAQPSGVDSTLTAAVYKVLSDPLSLPQEFTKWVYAVVANPVSPQLGPVSSVVNADNVQVFTAGAPGSGTNTQFRTDGCWLAEVQFGTQVVGGAIFLCYYLGPGIGARRGTTVINSSVPTWPGGATLSISSVDDGFPAHGTFFTVICEDPASASTQVTVLYWRVPQALGG